MVRGEDLRLRKIRDAMVQARPDNARMIAAVIGGHLAKVARQEAAPEILSAGDAVRDASLDLLRSINRRTGVAPARRVALSSLDRLAQSIHSAQTAPEMSPRDRLRSPLDRARDLLGTLRRR